MHEKVEPCPVSLTNEQVRAILSKDVDSAKILEGLDLKTATDAEIDDRFDSALACRQDEIRPFYHATFTPPVRLPKQP